MQSTTKRRSVDRTVEACPFSTAKILKLRLTLPYFLILEIVVKINIIGKISAACKPGFLCWGLLIWALPLSPAQAQTSPFGEDTLMIRETLSTTADLTADITAPPH